MNFLLKKGAKSSPLPDHGLYIKVSGLLGQRFFGKIQNGERRFELDRGKKVI